MYLSGVKFRHATTLLRTGAPLAAVHIVTSLERFNVRNWLGFLEARLGVQSSKRCPYSSSTDLALAERLWSQGMTAQSATATTTKAKKDVCTCGLPGFCPQSTANF